MVENPLALADQLLLKSSWSDPVAHGLREYDIEVPGPSGSWELRPPARKGHRQWKTVEPSSACVADSTRRRAAHRSRRDVQSSSASFIARSAHTAGGPVGRRRPRRNARPGRACVQATGPQELPVAAANRGRAADPQRESTHESRPRPVKPASSTIAAPRSTRSSPATAVVAGRRAASRWVPTRRYESAQPGALLHLDVKHLTRFDKPGHWAHGDRSEQHKSRGAGVQYAHCVIDSWSRLAMLSRRSIRTTAARPRPW